jgi:hypothetical protein
MDTISIETEHGRTEDGKHVYSQAEHDRLEHAVDRMDEETFRDWLDAPGDGRVKGSGGAKPKSAYSMAEKARFFEEQRAAGNDSPWDAWEALPE